MKNCFLLIVLLPFLLNAQSHQYQYTLEFSNKNTVYSKPLIDSAINVLNKRLKKFGIRDASVIYDQVNSALKINSERAIDTNYIRLRIIKPFKISFFETYTLKEFVQLLAPGGLPVSLKKNETDFYSLLSIEGDKLENANYYSYIGSLALKDTSRFKQLYKSLKPYWPDDLSFVYSSRPSSELSNALFVYALKNNTSMLAANNILVSAFLDFDESSHAGVQIELNETGSKKFLALTQRNIGRPLAIVIDNRVYTAPFVAGEIPGGKLLISGLFSLSEATEIANMLSTGFLPVDLLYKD